MHLKALLKFRKPQTNSVPKSSPGASDTQPAAKPSSYLRGMMNIFRPSKRKGARNGADRTPPHAQNQSESSGQRPDAEVATPAQITQTAGVKDIIMSNLPAVLSVVQQLGKLIKSVPFLEPAGVILTEAVKVYQEVDSNSGKQDELSEKVDALNDGIAQAISWFKNCDQVDPVGRLGSDVKTYLEKVEKVEELLTVHRDHGWFSNIVNRGKIGENLVLLDKQLDDFGNIFQTKCLINIQGKLDEIAKTQDKMVLDIGTTLEILTKGEHTKIIKWLSLINSFTRQAEILRTRQPGTVEWILGDDCFTQWEAGSGRILWGRGIPGAGKTVLASVVVDHLQKKNVKKNIGVACIYLNHKETGTQTPSNLLASLLSQLVLDKTIGSTSAVQIQKMFQQHSPKRTRPELAEISEILSLVVAEWSKVYIIVDGLDEYPVDDQKTLLEHLTAMGVCLMLTSRHNVALPNTDAETFEIRGTKQDIQKYVEEQITHSSDLRSIIGSSGLSQDIIEKILCNVDGMFLLARLHVASFKACTTIANIREKVKNLTGDLGDAYKEAIDRINHQHEKRKNLALSVLTWVANAKRLLTVPELQDALAVEPDANSFDPENCPEISIILTACAGLVIVDEQSERVRLVHATTQKYLDDSNLFPEAHTEITRTLLTYMACDNILQYALHNQSPFFEKKAHPLLKYCSYCLLHAVGPPEAELRNAIVNFLELAATWYTFWKYQSLGQGNSSSYPWNHPDWPKSASPLWVAAASNLQETAKYLLDSGGVSPNVEGDPLSVASFYGHIQMAKELLKRGAEINSRALEGASSQGDTDMVCLLLEKGANVCAEEDIAIRVAAKAGRTKIVEMLLAKGANLNAVDGQNSTALHVAAGHGHIETVHFLLQNGADINPAEEYTGNPLEAAACWTIPFYQSNSDNLAKVAADRMELVQLLLEKGANVNRRNGGALRAASKAGHKDIVQIFLENGANVNAVGGEDGSALKAASSKGQIDIVQFLLEKGADVNLDDLAVSALEAATCWNGFDRNNPRMTESQIKARRLSLVRLLLDEGANINDNNDGPLRAASKAGHKDIVQILLENGANVNAIGGEDCSALKAASSKGQIDIVQFLLEKGADVNLDGLAVGALEAATCWNDPYWMSTESQRKAWRLSLVSLLLDKGANIHHNNNGPLRAASKAGHKDIVQILLENGANVNAVNGEDGSALKAALSRGQIDIVQFLLEKGANVNPDDLEAAICWNDWMSNESETKAQRLSLVRLLLDKGANIRHNNGGPLCAASKAGHKDIVQILLENGANVNAVSKEDSSALKAASSEGQIDIVRFLLEKGADVNLDGLAVGALEAAICWNDPWLSNEPETKAWRLSLVRLLLEKGANIHHNNNGPLRAASKAGHKEVVQLLLENGANADPLQIELPDDSQPDDDSSIYTRRITR